MEAQEKLRHGKIGDRGAYGFEDCDLLCISPRRRMRAWNSLMQARRAFKAAVEAITDGLDEACRFIKDRPRQGMIVFHISKM